MRPKQRITIMKNYFRLVILFLCFSLASTSFASEGSGEKIGKKIDVKIEEAQNYSQEKKEKIQKEFQTQLDKIDADIQILKRKINNTKKTVSADVKAHWTDNVNLLEKRRIELRQDLESLQQSSGNAWEELKTGMQNAVADLKSSFKKAKKEFAHSDKKAQEKVSTNDEKKEKLSEEKNKETIENKSKNKNKEKK